MVEVAEIAEDCTLPGEAFQKIISDGGLIVLIFEDNDEHVVEMLWRGRGTGAGGNILRKAENREGPNGKCFTCKTVDVTAPERHDPPKFHVPLVRQDYPWSVFRSVLMLTPNLAATPPHAQAICSDANWDTTDLESCGIGTPLFKRDQLKGLWDKAFV